MFLLPPHLRRLLERNKAPKKSRTFLQDQDMVTIAKKMAKQQNRSEEEVIADFTKIGWDQFLMKSDLDECWNSLSFREQQVVALTCLGHMNYEIAEILSIAPGTVKTHLQNIFLKFNIRSRKELRIALKIWDFTEWWEHNQHN
jgi:ATP/maltotriose-dependent transcriptional regulator MalT